MQVLPLWQLSLPLPAVLMVSVGLYMLLLGLGLWLRHCVKDSCPADCAPCCPSVSLSERCLALAQMCDCSLPTADLLPPPSCPSCPSCPSFSCDRWDCTCTCQPPECESCNCLCFEIRIK